MARRDARRIAAAPLWLNWACLGRRNSEDASIDMSRAAYDLKSALRACVEWAAAWMRCPAELVVLTSGATDACDAILRAARRPRAESIVVSDRAHPTVAEATRRAAKYLSAFGGATVAYREIALPDDP